MNTAFLTLALALPLVARAADVPVTYTFQDKPLKQSTIAGAPLTFTLYSDSARPVLTLPLFS